MFIVHESKNNLRPNIEIGPLCIQPITMQLAHSTTNQIATCPLYNQSQCDWPLIQPITMQKAHLYNQSQCNMPHSTTNDNATDPFYNQRQCNRPLSNQSQCNRPHSPTHLSRGRIFAKFVSVWHWNKCDAVYSVSPGKSRPLLPCHRYQGGEACPFHTAPKITIIIIF